MNPRTTSPIRYYYWATALFVVLDYLLDVNVRLAPLEAFPAWRAFYYIFCFACLGLMLWRPGWTNQVAVVESLVTLSMLIITMGVRVLSVPDAVSSAPESFVTGEEILNFAIAGSVAWYAYIRSAQAVREELRHR